MKKGERLELFVEKMVFEGAGLARVAVPPVVPLETSSENPSNLSMPVFIHNAAPQEKVLAEIVSVNKNYAKAKLIEIIEPSAYRVKPFCSMANVCGGCCWQHIDYQEQLRQKKRIVQETVRKIAGFEADVRDVIPAAQIKEYRHKAQYPVAQTKVSKRVLAGYYKKNTHELVNIKHCPIQPQIIDEVTDFIRETAIKCAVSAYDETKHKGMLRHIVFRHSKANDEMLVIFVVNDTSLQESVKNLAQKVFSAFDNVVGCLVNFNPNRTNVILGKTTKCIVGRDFYTEKLGDKTYRISAGSFFQVNPQSALNILNIVKGMIEKEVLAPEILDAYSGVSSFGIYLGDIAKTVTCVEDFPSATADARENVKLNGYENFEILTGDAKVQLQNLVENGKSFDVVIADPPRKGLDTAAVDTAAALSKKLVVYVSCNPSTLARDLKLFVEKGFELQYIQPVDMFCHTYHIENVALLKKRKNNYHGS